MKEESLFLVDALVAIATFLLFSFLSVYGMKAILTDEGVMKELRKIKTESLKRSEVLIKDVK